MNETSVLPLLIRIAEAGSIAAVWALSSPYFASLGFARQNYGFTKFHRQTSIGDPDDALFMTTCDVEYARLYFSNGFFARTPVFRWAERNSGSCTWAWVKDAYEAGQLSEDEIDAVRRNAAMGIFAGVSVSFPQASARSKGAIGLIADPGLGHREVEGIWATNREAMLAVAHMMHLRIIQLPHLLPNRALTPRQREVLEWVADGKTTLDIVLLMQVSAATVEKHLRLAREALNVETTAQAVAKAALLNMIFQRDPDLPVSDGALPV